MESRGQSATGCHAPQPRRPVQTAQARSISPCRDGRPRKSHPRAPDRPSRENLLDPSRAPGRPGKPSLEADERPAAFKNPFWSAAGGGTDSKILFGIALAPVTAGRFFFASAAHPADLTNDFRPRPDTRQAPRTISRSRRSAFSPVSPPKGRSRARRAHVTRYPASSIQHPVSSIRPLSSVLWPLTPDLGLTLALAPNPAC